MATMGEMAMEAQVRPFGSGDEVGWVRCRALSFLGSSYFDDVLPAKPVYEVPSVELVATVRAGADDVVGVLDVTVDGVAATIETIATHPDHARTGVATLLLQTGLVSLGGVEVLEAWTRDDAAANSWYQRQGFVETFRYLHVYAFTDDEIDAAVAATSHSLRAVRGFFHADIAQEADLRRRFGRVHVCRRYELRLSGGTAS